MALAKWRSSLRWKTRWPAKSKSPCDGGRTGVLTDIGARRVRVGGRRGMGPRSEFDTLLGVGREVVAGRLSAQS